MLRNFIPGKLARFAVLTLFVFLLAQNGAVRAQNSAGYVLEAVAPVSVAHDIARPPLQSGVILTAIGQICSQISGICSITWTFDFNPVGGPVNGYYDGNIIFVNDWGEETVIGYSSGTITGDFEGGDGGKVSGTFSGQSVYTNGETINTSGPWEGNLWADGTGNGFLGDNFTGNNTLWSVTFDAQAFQAALQPNPEPNPDSYIEPDPYIESDPYVDPNPDPNPNPDPGPISIDQETLERLQSILSAPGLPITGAVAGGLVAWIISMLGGGRTVLPTAPRPPTGGFRPGQVGPDGKIWSPGQGWVSKSTYDYQQKWLQKGWRWNSQTGKFEGQHGAVNENDQVLDDEQGWVDQKTFQDNEQMRSQGYVYDRFMGWQKPEDLNRIENERDGIRQRDREVSAEKNAKIQRELAQEQRERDAARAAARAKLEQDREVSAEKNAKIQKAVQDASQKRQEENQDSLKKDEQKEQMPVKLTNLNADLEAIDQDLKNQNIYVINKLQGDPVLMFQGVAIVFNGVWDSTIGNFTGSQGFTCGDYFDKTVHPVTAAVKKHFPGAKVQQAVFEEKSTKNPSGILGTLDSLNTENHILIKVTLPDGTPPLAVDFHQHNASNVLKNPPIVQSYDKVMEQWKKYLGKDFVEKTTPPF